MSTAGKNFFAVSSDPAVSNTQRLKVALYVDDGSAGNGVFHCIRLIAHSPQLALYGITGAGVREGKLAGMDLLMLPGGYSKRQYKSLYEEGAEKVREFIRAGGAYFGICAGCTCTLNDPDRLKLLPFHLKPHAGGTTALITVEFSEAGAKALDLAPGQYKVRYSGGPIPLPGEEIADGSGELLAVYKNTVSKVGVPEGNFFNEGAVLRGTLGKGKVVATSFHPEYWESNHPIVAGCIYAATGVKPSFVYPAKNPRSIRVGFWSSGFPDAVRAETMLALDRHPDIDVRIVTSHQFEEGELRHLDALAVAHDATGVCKEHLGSEFNRAQIAAFLERGGVIFASGTGAESVPKHRNVVELPIGADFVKPVLERF